MNCEQRGSQNEGLRMSDDQNFGSDGQPDGRGRSEGSKATQFTPGDGRRRPGRPRGSKSLRTIYRAVGQAKIAVTMNGKTLRLTKAEAIILKQAEKALRGEQRPAERFLDKIEQYSPVEVEPDLTAALLDADLEILASARKRGLTDSPALDNSEIRGAAVDGDDSDDEL